MTKVSPLLSDKVLVKDDRHHFWPVTDVMHRRAICIFPNSLPETAPPSRGTLSVRSTYNIYHLKRGGVLSKPYTQNTVPPLLPGPRKTGRQNLPGTQRKAVDQTENIG